MVPCVLSPLVHFRALLPRLLLTATLLPPPVQQCAPADIDARVIGSLANLAPADAIECLDKLENAARKSEIRNLSAYLAGVVKRVSHAGAGAGPGQPAPPLAPPAQRILDQLYSSGKVRQGELDSKVLRTLSQEPADVQTLVMGSFADRNLLGIRNMAGGRLGGPPPTTCRHGGFHPSLSPVEQRLTRSQTASLAALVHTLPAGGHHFRFLATSAAPAHH